MKSMDKVIWGSPSFWIARLPLYWGIDRGFFQEQGIALELWYSHGGPEMAQAVSQGSIHIGEMGLPPFLAAYQDGLEARVVGSGVIQQLDHYLAARPGISSPAELTGSRIGILSAGSCDEYFLRRILAAHDIDADDGVTLVPLGGDYGNLHVFSDGHVDTAFVVEPQLALGEHRGLFSVIGRVGDYYPHYQWCIILASQAWLRCEADLLRRLMRAFRRSCRSIKDDPAQAVTLGNKVFGVAPEVFEKALMRDLPRWEIGARLDSAGLQCALEIQANMGVVSEDNLAEDMVFQL